MPILAIILGLLVLAILIILAIAATKPATFSIQRTTDIDAAPDTIFPLINDFHNWRDWSPWEALDPDLKRKMSGAESGRGAVYESVSYTHLYGPSGIFLGLVDGRQVATCTLVVVPNFVRGGANYALIENVVTHADFRGRGHGKAVLLAAVDEAWALGCYKVMLLTSSKEPATLGFYHNAGFQTTKTGFEMRRLPVREG